MMRFESNEDFRKELCDKLEKLSKIVPEINFDKEIDLRHEAWSAVDNLNDALYELLKIYGKQQLF